MAEIKILKVDSNGHWVEHNDAADSVKMASLKTANNELTDSKLGNLIDGNESNNEHLHDARYFRENEHIDSSVGASDSGKPIKLDGDGKIDESMLDDGDVDHDNTNGAAASTVHTAYSLADGSRDYTGIQSYDSAKSFTDDAELVDKKYVDDLVGSAGTAAEWQDSCLDRLATPPVSPSTGDRYLVISTATGAWAGKEDDIAEYNGAGWDFTTPTNGTYTSIDDEADGLYLYLGSWSKKYYEATTASLGCEKVGLDIRLDLLNNGGLALTGNEVGVDAQDFDGEGLIANSALDLAIDWSSSYDDSKAVKASDLSSVANGKGASIIGVEDANSKLASTDVEAALEEIYDLAAAGGFKSYTAGAGGVSKGDLLYVSANDTVLPMPINAAHEAVGIAIEDADAAATVKLVEGDYLLSGVASGMSIDQKYYWTGSAWTSTIPATSGNYVWMLGRPKNATILDINVEFIKKNA